MIVQYFDGGESCRGVEEFWSLHVAHSWTGKVNTDRRRIKRKNQPCVLWRVLMCIGMDSPRRDSRSLIWCFDDIALVQNWTNVFSRVEIWLFTKIITHDSHHSCYHRTTQWTRLPSTELWWLLHSFTHVLSWESKVVDLLSAGPYISMPLLFSPLWFTMRRTWKCKISFNFKNRHLKRKKNLGPDGGYISVSKTISLNTIKPENTYISRPFTKCSIDEMYYHYYYCYTGHVCTGTHRKQIVPTPQLVA